MRSAAGRRPRGPAATPRPVVVSSIGVNGLPDPIAELCTVLGGIEGETTHALACERRLWVLNEKKLVERVGLGNLDGWFARVPDSSPALVDWVEALRTRLGRARDRDAAGAGS